MNNQVSKGPKLPESRPARGARIEIRNYEKTKHTQKVAPRKGRED